MTNEQQMKLEIWRVLVNLREETQGALHPYSSRHIHTPEQAAKKAVEIFQQLQSPKKRS